MRHGMHYEHKDLQSIYYYWGEILRTYQLLAMELFGNLSSIIWWEFIISYV